jgi:hypothetical protein
MLGMRPPILSVSPALTDYFDSITTVIEPAYQLNTSLRPDPDLTRRMLKRRNDR